MDDVLLSDHGDWGIYIKPASEDSLGAIVYRVSPHPPTEGCASFSCTDREHARRLVRELTNCVSYEARTTAIVQVHGGCVTGVWSDRDLTVQVIDHDNLDGEEDTERQAGIDAANRCENELEQVY